MKYMDINVCNLWARLLEQKSASDPKENQIA